MGVTLLDSVEKSMMVGKVHRLTFFKRTKYPIGLVFGSKIFLDPLFGGFVIMSGLHPGN
jgi:hypothetical protein